MSLGYAAEKLGNAIWYLASGTKPLQDRLANVWVEQLSNIYPPRDLTEDLRDRWEMLHTMVTMDPDDESGRGPYGAVISALSDDAATEVVEEILMMRDLVEHAITLYGQMFPHSGSDGGRNVHNEPPPPAD